MGDAARIGAADRMNRTAFARPRFILTLVAVLPTTMSKRTAPETATVRLVDLLADGRYPAASRDNILGSLPEEILTEELMDLPLAQQLLLESPNKHLAVVARHHLVEHFARVVQENVAAMREWRASTSAFLEVFVAPLSRVTRFDTVQPSEYATGFVYVGPERRVPIAWVLRNADARLLGPAMDEADWDALIALAHRYSAATPQHDAPSVRAARTHAKGITTLVRLIRATPARVSTFVEVLHRLITLVLDPQNRAFFDETKPYEYELDESPLNFVLKALLAEWCAQGSERPPVDAADDDDDDDDADEATGYREINLDSTAVAAYWLTYFQGLLVTVEQDGDVQQNEAASQLIARLHGQQRRALVCLWTGESAHDPASAPQRRGGDLGHWFNTNFMQRTYAAINFMSFNAVATSAAYDWGQGAPATDFKVFNTSAAFLFDWTWEHVGSGHVFTDYEAFELSSLVAPFWRLDTWVRDGKACRLLRRATRAITRIGDAETTKDFLDGFVSKLRAHKDGQTLEETNLHHAQIALLTVAMVGDMLADTDIRDIPFLRRLLYTVGSPPGFDEWVQGRVEQKPRLAAQVARVRAICTAAGR